jgi:peptide/nickel transport system permease protein
MTAFLVRRFVQMLVVIFLSSVVSYGLLYLSPGGPVKCPGPDPRCQKMTRSDIQRQRERFELDLALPVRFTRWFIGQPRGPITIGGQELFADVAVGCSEPRLVRVRYPDGTEGVMQKGCNNPLTLAELEGRRSSRGVLFGDFGLSQVIMRDQPVSEVIGSRIWYTLALMGISTLITLVIAIPIGIYSAVRQYSRFDYVMTTTAFVGSSLPTFFFGIIMILVLSVLAKEAGLPYLPSAGATANRDYVVPLIFGEITVEKQSWLDYLMHFIMPCAVLTFVSIAQWSRFIRSSMLEVLRQEYVRTARAKGVREHLVILRHGFRNALIPFITLLANILPNLFAGAAITEQVFTWPGLGWLLIDALGRYDYSVVLALLYITIVLQLIGYIISDILYTVADPRIRLA